MSTGIITQMMKSFQFTFGSGGERLVPEALVILGLILVIELSLLGVMWLVAGEANMPTFVWKCVGFLLLLGLIVSWKRLTTLCLVGFIELGLYAGGDAISVTDFTDPGNIAGYGFHVTAALYTKLMSYTGADAILNLPEILIASPIGFCIVLAYAILGTWIFVTLLDFYIHAAITTILLPFALNTKVAFLAEKAIACVCASLLRVLVLAFITGATLPFMVSMAPGLNPTLHQLFGHLVGAMAILALAWRADKSAQGLLYGTPRLSISDVYGGVMTVVHTARTVGRTLGSMVQTRRRS